VLDRVGPTAKATIAYGESERRRATTPRGSSGKGRHRATRIPHVDTEPGHALEGKLIWWQTSHR
jgi:hypothetical protein